MYNFRYKYPIALGLFAGLVIIFQLILHQGTAVALAFAALPAILLGIGGIIHKQYTFYAFFILNYVIMGINRYIPIKSGMIMTVLALGIIVISMVKEIQTRQDWGRSKNFLTFAWCIWLVYCILEIFNPSALAAPWSIAIANYAFFPLFCAILVPVFFTRYKNFQWLLIIWASLTLLAAFKGYWQRNQGFDTTELRWLFEEGGGSTHLINTGIRFFSFFSDAASYGASMGLSLIVFGISGFYARKKWLKILFWLAALGGGYGLVISGTRSSLAIPFVGLAVYLVLCRNTKAIFTTAVLLIGSFVFLNYTTIGNSNRLIRRMRSAFDLNDASFQIRQNNQQQVYHLMKDKPFGIGLGLAGDKADRFRPVNRHDPLTYMATDSWYVMTLVETGIAGLTLYLLILLAILFKATYIASFRILNRELQGQLYAIIAAISGILVTCYGNEVLNYPNGIIVYTLMAILYIAPYYDRELNQHEANT